MTVHDVAVVGGGTAGCIVAARLEGEHGLSVVLIELGPIDTLDAPVDPFPGLASGAGVLRCPIRSSIGNIGPPHYVTAARLGGGSAVNAMIAEFAAPGDYDAWASDAGCSGWSWRELSDDAAELSRGLPCSSAPVGDVGTVLGEMFTDARPAPLWWHRDEDAQGRRISPATELLAPLIRDADSRGRVEVVRARVRSIDDGGVGSAEPLIVRLNDGNVMSARAAVLCAGALSTPGLLVRSGVVHPSIGTGLSTHPGMMFAIDRGAGGAPGGSAPVSIVVDVHVSTSTGSMARGQLMAFEQIDASRRWSGVAAVLLDVSSSGSIGDPGEGELVEPVDFGALSSAADREALGEIAAVAREALSDGRFARLGEVPTMSQIESSPRWLEENLWHLSHAVGTCAMGPNGVVDNRGRVPGTRLWVADSSAMPRLIAAHPNMTVALVARRIAGFVAEEFA